MEGQLWKAILIVLSQIDKRRKRAAERFSDEEIVLVFYWAVIHDRPVSWACAPENWPPHARRRSLPSNATMSRRQRSRHVVALLNAIEQHVTRPAQTGLCWLAAQQSDPTAAELVRTHPIPELPKPQATE